MKIVQCLGRGREELQRAEERPFPGICFGMQAYRVRGGRKRMLAGGAVEVEVFIGGGGGGEVKIAHCRSRSSLLYRII